MPSSKRSSRNVSGAARGYGHVVGAPVRDKSAIITRLEQPALTKQQKREIPRAACAQCGRMVMLRPEGTLAGHQSRRGISCVGGRQVP